MVDFFFNLNEFEEKKNWQKYGNIDNFCLPSHTYKYISLFFQAGTKTKQKKIKTN